MKKQLSIFCVIVLFHMFAVPRAGFSWFSILGYKAHQELAKKASADCGLKLPKPPKKDCEKPVSDKELLQRLMKGSIEPDGKYLPGVGATESPKHAYNPVLENNDQMIKAVSEFYIKSQNAINAGLAIETIGVELTNLKGLLSRLTCESKGKDYAEIWGKFGVLSHYPADIAVPLHAYSVNVDGKYHEGDLDTNGNWYKGLWDYDAPRHGHIEREMEKGVNFNGLACKSIDPIGVATNARAAMIGYTSKIGTTGYRGLVDDFDPLNLENDQTDYVFFRNIGQAQANDALGGIYNVWKKALEDFSPPENCECKSSSQNVTGLALASSASGSNCDPPLGGCGSGDCETQESGICRNFIPGNDHSDDTVSAATTTTASTSDDLLEQAWDRLAVKKNKKSLIWYWMQEYLLGEYYEGNIDEATYQMLSTSYGLTADEASELFYDDYITSPDVAILGRGFALSMSDLLQNKFYEPIRRFTVEDFSPDALKDYPIFIIPSGGLMGLEKSDVFRAKLDEYVKNGGTVIVFGQQHGYEFSVLPVPQEADGSYKTITGYGWSEDQSCQFRSSYIDTSHQILSGQSNATPNINVDGYFTDYPSNATVLLRRTANGQPDLLMYEYGQGRVIVTSMYSDFAIKANQAFSDEIALVRDMISWAKKPDELPEVKPGQTVSVSVKAANITTHDASSVKLSIYNPDRTTLLSEQTVNISVPAGQTTTIPVTQTTAQTSALGIYHIDYILYDPSGTIIQPQAETDSGRFVVSKPPANPYKNPDFSFSIQSDAEHYLYGSPMTLTVNAWNNTDVDHFITFKYNLASLGINGTYTFSLPQKSTASHNIVVPEVKARLVWVNGYFYDETGRFVGGVFRKGMWIDYPSANVASRTNKSIYAKGETVVINTSLKNNIGFSWQPTVKIAVMDPKWTKVFEDSKTLVLPPSGTGSISTSFILPLTLLTGSYQVDAQVLFDNRNLAGTWMWFEMPQSQISVTPNLSSAFNTGTNAIPFVIRNTGNINVYSGTIDLSLKAPVGSIVYSGNQPFSLGVGESKTLDIPISIPSLKLGNYFLTYSQSDETRTGKPAPVTLSNSYNLNLSFDKPVYKIGETANLTASITNTGKFLQEASLTMDVPFLGLSETRPVTLNPSETANIPFSLSLPLTVKQGGAVKVTLNFPSGDRIEKEIYLAIKPVKINEAIVFDKASYRIRGNLGINYTITNDGNFASPVNVGFNLSILDLNYTYAGSLTLEPLKDAAVPFSIPIPENILAGWHKVAVALTLPWGTVTKETGFVVPESSLILSYLGTTTPRVGDTISLTIENTGGVDTTYTTEKLSMIDKQAVEIYHGSATGTILTGEKKTLTDIQIPAQTANGPILVDVEIRDSKTGNLTKYLKALDVIGLISDVHVRTDKDVYLKTEPITGISTILNSSFGLENGNLKIEVKNIWSKTGQFSHFLPKKAWWSFYLPQAVAIGPYGYVYVLDTGNNRIQKFDNSGNLITKWGSYGYGNGQFYNPYGIAVGPDGFVYVADSANNRVQKFDSNGNFVAKWGGYGTGNGQFNYPNSIAVGPDGFVYVVDYSNHRIQKFDSGGNFITKWGSRGSGVGQFEYPDAIAIGPDGSVYVADWGNHRILKFDTNGSFIIGWGSYGYGNGQFYNPYGIAVGSDGYVYVADGNNRIQKFDNSGNFITKWGGLGSGDGQFSSPKGLAISSDDFVYVTDSRNNRIQKFDSNGNFITKWAGSGSGDGEFSYPNNIALGSDGYVYVADGNNRIQKFDITGNFIMRWGSKGSGDGQFNLPYGIAVSSDNYVYVVDSSNHRIQKFDSSGNFISRWGSYGSGNGQFNSPKGITLSSEGYVYVVDSSNHRIQKFDSIGIFVAKWGSYGSGDGQFSFPNDIAVSSDGLVYIADSGNRRIQKFDSSGNFIAKWGSYGSGDGQFYRPYGIAVESSDWVYVVDYCDYCNDRIQKFDTNGNFITKWGTPGSEDGQFIDPFGIALGSGGSVYVADSGNHRIQRMTAEDIVEILFETTFPINQPASATQDYITSIGTLNTTGKLNLQATLKNTISQTIVQASYPFYVVEGNTILSFGTDKRLYKPGETVTITGQVENLASIEAANLTITLNSKLATQGPQLLYSETFNVPAGGSHPFIVTTTAGSEGAVTLTGKVTQNNSTLVEITDQYEVAKPNVSVTVSVPGIAGSPSFSINVEMKNTGKVEAIIQFGVQSAEFGDLQTISIPAGEIKLLQYSQQVSKDTTYTFTFAGDLNQTIQKQIRFGEKAEVQLTLQPLYKEGNIAIAYQLKNMGELGAIYPVTFTLLSNGQEISKATRTFTLPVGASVSDSLSYNLNQGSYILRYETQGFQAESQINVAKAAQGEITMAVNNYYPEGTIIIPYTIKNIGPFDAEFTIGFELGVSLILKTAFIPAGGNYSDDLRFNLAFGNYTIKATLVSQPSNPLSKSFQVLRENIAEMIVALGTQTNGLIPVNVNLINIGFNEINGSVNVSVNPLTGQAIWNAQETFSQLLPQNSQLITLNINPSAIAAGNYNLQVTLLSNANQVIAVRSLEFVVRSANFQITQLPPYQTFTAGQEATFTFRVKNTGDQEGSFDLRFKAYDLIDSTQREWLKPGEEKALSFSFVLPEDLEEKDYFADYELKGAAVSGVSKGQIKYHFTGINLNVNASLDKPYYNEGETAHLTINIQSTSPNPQNLFARVNYAGFEPQQTFTLSGSQVLIYDVPLPKITGEKLFYGIYHESGRSIYLNSLYIHKAGDILTITTNKQVYNPGETVTLSVIGNTSGNITLSGPGGYTETFAFTGSATRSFNLPSIMAAGTYFINVELRTPDSELRTVTHPFDVAGIQVKVLECQNDKGKYASSDTIATSFTISSNQTIPAILKAWIVDPKGQYANVGEQSMNLSSSENSLITQHSSLITSVSGIHRLVYGIYASGDLLLASGSEAFDVGDAVILGLSTDKRDYPSNTEQVRVIASLFGSVIANLQLELDGNLIKTESISLNGSYSYQTQLQNITPGPHVLKATLTAGGLKSTKETSFTYALAFMPKPQISASSAYVDFGSINLSSTSTQTITISNTGNANLSIGTITLTGANQVEFSKQNDNCSGMSIPASGNCTLHILFSPTSLGTKSASLSIPSNAPDTPTLYLPLGGTGVTTLNLTINTTGSGNITGIGIDCPGDCTETYTVPGTTVQLTATPLEGYQFVNWTGDINKTENPVTINMETNKNITANFIINTYTINATAGSGGTITPSGLVKVNRGSSQTFTITPNLGYHIVDVKVDGASVGVVTSYTFNNVTSNHTIEASFVINQYTISAIAGPNGTISPSGSITVNHGSSQTFTITPNAGYHVADVLVDGGSVEAVKTYTFINTTANHTIEASFAQGIYTLELPRTGQITKYAQGDDGYIRAGIIWPIPRFTANEDTTQTDNLTGLIWGADAGTPTFGTCAGGIKSWQGALDYIACLNGNNFLGHNDWRLPNVNELESLIHAGQANNSTWLISQGFTNVAMTYYWSSTTLANSPNQAWGISLQMGDVAYGSKNSNNHVWPVRGMTSGPAPLWKTGQTATSAIGDDGNLREGLALPGPRYTINADTTLTDNLTGIIWASDAGTSTIGTCTGGTKTWQGALDYIACLNTNNYLGHNDWRMPNRKEMRSLINYGQADMVLWLNTQGFSNVNNAEYWSSTTYASSSDSAWSIEVASGDMGASPKSTPLYVLPVRGGTLIPNQPPNSAPAGGGVYEINTPILLKGQVSDFDGDLITYEWLEGNRLILSGQIGTTYGGSPVNLPEQTITLGLGNHIITLRVNDGVNPPVTSDVAIQVIDTTAPTLAPVPDKTILWPPNHKMVDITIWANARDDSGDPVLLSAIVTSNEPQEGLGDGDTSPDWTEPVIDQINGIITLQLRSERSGTGNGRIYTITITARDTSGNKSQAKVEIIVPHDKGKK